MSTAQIVQSLQESDKPIFTLCPASDFQNQAEMTWLVDDILPSTGLASVYGGSGLGKSFLCLDMAAAVALGLHWFGRPTRQARVVYVPLEGRGGFPRRIKAWATHNGVDFPDEVEFVQESFAFNKRGHAQALGEAIVQGGGAGLIIIDTLNKAAPGADENSSTDMGRIIEGATTIQELTGALVLLIHHPGKDSSRGLRGHSSLHAALDAIIEIRKDGELTRWTLIKSKDGEDNVGHAFRLSPVEIGCDDTGKTINSCVVEAVEGVVASVEKNQPTGANQKAILNAAREILNQRRMDFVTETSDTPEGMAFDHLLEALKDVLVDVPPKHRKLRTKEALERVCEMGYLATSEGLICLPANN